MEEIKKRLIELIEKSENPQLLEVLHVILTTKTPGKSYLPGKEQIMPIKEAPTNYGKADAIAKDIVDQEMLEWLQKEIELGWDGPESTMTMDQIIESKKK